MTVLSIILIVLFLSLCPGALFVFITLRSRHHKSAVDRRDPLGMSARVESKLEPDGAIILKGELWRAQVKSLSTQVVPGTIVRVVGVNGHLLVVEPVD